MPEADTASVIVTLAGLVELPELPPAGSGWSKHALVLFDALAASSKVIDEILVAVPEAEKKASPKAADDVLDALGVIGRDALEQIQAGAVTLSGAAILKAPKVALARTLVLAWLEANALRDLYMTTEADGARIWGRVPSEERVKDYSGRLGIAQAITRLGDAGIVELLRTTGTAGHGLPWLVGEAASGLGSAALVDLFTGKQKRARVGLGPVAVVLVWIAVAAAVALLAYVLVSWIDLGKRQQSLREKFCFDEHGKPIRELAKYCLPQDGGGMGWGVAAGLGAAILAFLAFGRGR